MTLILHCRQQPLRLLKPLHLKWLAHKHQPSPKPTRQASPSLSACVRVYISIWLTPLVDVRHLWWKSICQVHAHSAQGGSCTLLALLCEGLFLHGAAGSPPVDSPQVATLATALATAATQNVHAAANVIAQASARKPCCLQLGLPSCKMSYSSPQALLKSLGQPHT